MLAGMCGGRGNEREWQWERMRLGRKRATRNEHDVYVVCVGISGGTGEWRPPRVAIPNHGHNRPALTRAHMLVDAGACGAATYVRLHGRTPEHPRRSG